MEYVLSVLGRGPLRAKGRHGLALSYKGSNEEGQVTCGLLGF